MNKEEKCTQEQFSVSIKKPTLSLSRTQIVIALLSLFYDRMKRNEKRKLHVGWQQQRN